MILTYPAHRIEHDQSGRAAANRPPDVNLFADFNGADADSATRTDFYHHDHHWTNRLILGDSLLVMTSLAEKERLKVRPRPGARAAPPRS